MINKSRVDYEVEDFLCDESFINYHLQQDSVDKLSWQQWLATHPEKIAIVNQAKELIQTLSISLPEDEYQHELEKVTAAINAPLSNGGLQVHNPYEHSKSYRKRKRILFYLFPVILVSIAAAYIFFQRGSNHKQLIETVNNHATPIVITLSDSTVVTLAPQSMLKYPVRFNNNNRNVYLTGEAQFNVKRNEVAPFKVYSKNVVATVLGTVFNFRKSGDSTVVELLNGKLHVQLNDKNINGDQIVLSPNDKAVYVNHDKHFFKQAYTHRVDLHFRQNTFNEIALQIKNTFGVTVINKSNKKNWSFTGEFKNTSAKDVIESICMVKGLTAESKADTLYIK